MIKAIIIEDERPAMEDLASTLAAIAEDVQVIARLGSVREGIEYIQQRPVVDLVFSDVQLGDGLSFEIFNRPDIRIPVIFITGYDEFMLRAFENNGIDYLLKPVNGESLRKALDKYRMLEKHFTDHHAISKVLQYMGHQKRKRIVVKKGMENISLRLEDAALFYTEDKIAYAIDRWGKKYMVDKNLSELQQELDNFVFFRANRQYIININFVRGFKSYEKVKLMVELTLPELNHRIIVSQETAPQFREWMHKA